MASTILTWLIPVRNRAIPYGDIYFPRDATWAQTRREANVGKISSHTVAHLAQFRFPRGTNVYPFISCGIGKGAVQLNRTIHDNMLLLQVSFMCVRE